MNNRSQDFRFRQGMVFGMAAAEQDVLLRDSFFPSLYYSIIRDRNDPRCGIVGRSGSGKTAILERLKLDGLRTLSINPEELAFQYLGSSDLIQALRHSGVNLDYFYKLLWRHVFVVEILKHRFPSDVRQAGLISQLIERIKKSVNPDPARDRAIQYLDDWGATVLQEPHERIQQIHETLESRLRTKIGVGGSWKSILGIEGEAGGELSHKLEVEEWVKVAQEIVSQIQIQDLNAVKNYIGTVVIDNPQNPCFVLIDDLDRFWVEDAIIYEIIRALLLEIYEWRNVPNIKIVYALRDNVLHKLENDFGSRSYQREKLADQRVHLQWTPNELVHIGPKARVV